MGLLIYMKSLTKVTFVTFGNAYLKTMSQKTAFLFVLLNRLESCGLSLWVTIVYGGGQIAWRCHLGLTLPICKSCLICSPGTRYWRKTGFNFLLPYGKSRRSCSAFVQSGHCAPTVCVSHATSKKAPFSVFCLLWQRRLGLKLHKQRLSHWFVDVIFHANTEQGFPNSYKDSGQLNQKYSHFMDCTQRSSCGGHLCYNVMVYTVYFFKVLHGWCDLLCPSEHCCPNICNPMRFRQYWVLCSSQVSLLHFHSVVVLRE